MAIIKNAENKCWQDVEKLRALVHYRRESKTSKTMQLLCKHHPMIPQSIKHWMIIYLMRQSHFWRYTQKQARTIFLVHQRSLPLTKWAELNGGSHANLWWKGLLNRGKRKHENELRAYLVCSEFTKGAGVLEWTQCEERHGQSSSHRGGGFVSYWAL